MKKLFVGSLFVCFALAGRAQTQAPINSSVVTKLPALDKSPMDMCYFPTDYPLLKTQNKTTQMPLARVIYSRPQRDNRVIFGDLIEYNKVWRLGANEATEIEFFKDVTVSGKKIPRGRYTLYAIPTPTKWTIIINKDMDTWGAFVYNEKKDVLRTDVPVQTLAAPVEAFSMNFIKSDKGANLYIAWENVSVSLPIEIK
ncbi:MAG TPA: DUF2911 domain-containing protein [Flavisolibacter sp.]|nr:DUF2911 domain-containing protein [Flavisolibacter sp.]